MKTGLTMILLAGTTLALSGCATPNFGVDHNCQLPGTFEGPINCLSSVSMPLGIPIPASVLANQFDAEKFTIDMSGSNVGLPSSGLFNITLNNNTGQPVSQASFSWTKNGNIITVNNPNAVHDWMASVPASVSSLGAQFVSMPVVPHIGANAYMFSIKYDGVLQGSAGQVWMEACNSGPQNAIGICPSGF